ncbi:MAG: ubiquitin-like domain-containing protein [Anaerolineaceae bacterium]|nr:ubiquitin-like domain-containing protein [Anaerolineaceae bacterium]
MPLRLWHLVLILPLSLLALLAAALLLAPFVLEKDLTLVVDGQALSLRSRAGLVGQLLSEQGIALQPGDLVEPGLTSLLLDGQQVRVNYARDVLLGVDGVTRILRSPLNDPAALLAEAGLALAPGDALFVNGQRFDPAWSMDPATPLRQLELRRPQPFLLQDGDALRNLRSSARTVGEALLENGVALREGDVLHPPAATSLVANMTLQLRRALPLTLHADGESRPLRLPGETVAEALAAAGVQLADEDYSIPPGDTTLVAGMQLRVIRVREELVYERETLSHRTLTQADPELELDQRRVLQQGQDGIRGLPQRIRYENGAEVSRETGAAEMLQEPMDHIIGLGSKIVLRSINTPQGPRQFWRVLRMKATSYHPGSVGNSTTTATGAFLRKGIVASNPKVIPYGTEVYVEGYGVGSMEDTAAAWYVRQQPMFIDLGYSDADFQSWSKWVDVYLLTPVPYGRFPLTLPG